MVRFTPTIACAALLSLAACAASAASLQGASPEIASRFAPMSDQTVQGVPLKDGFTLHEYQDGRMAVENPFGRPVRIEAGTMLTAANGASIRMVGDEVARLTAEMRTHDHR
ncbi:MAG: CopK family periplasmic copper-binding protein [Rhodoferax sp.]|nr:CopK family periplasmic copper-binding protein [Rhodoferax sp.]